MAPLYSHDSCRVSTLQLGFSTSPLWASGRSQKYGVQASFLSVSGASAVEVQTAYKSSASQDEAAAAAGCQSLLYQQDMKAQKKEDPFFSTLNPNPKPKGGGA